MGSVIEIPVHKRGKQISVALIDEVSLPLVSGRRWGVIRGYAAYGERIAGKRRTVLMHRLILGLKPGDGLECDHINRDRLDNRRCNLRVVTHAENGQNQGSNKRRHKECARLPRGVSWNKDTSKWRAVSHLNGKQHHLGLYDDPAEAGRVAAEWRAAHMPFSAEGTDHKSA